YVKRAIDSIQQQTFSDWELIIVDDGSSDNSLDIINNYVEQDDRIKLYSHANNENKGLSETVKLALSKCSGDYIAFLESDDIWDENNLSEKIQIIKRYPDIAIISNDVELFGDKKRMSNYDNYFSFQAKTFNKLTFPCNIFTKLLKENFIPTFSCVMVKAECLKACNFDIPYTPWLDRYLCLQIAYRGKFYFINKKLTQWRIHTQSYIKKEANAYKIKNNQKIKSMVASVFLKEKNPLKRFLLIYFYYISALVNKYSRAVFIRLKKKPI
ncbi:MAG: glycosyltransferase, partial [Candidatus Peribacteraceae bacterium]|nr:glycosyltransferase [Candidatus Peribacteraceae bacterium]